MQLLWAIAITMGAVSLWRASAGLARGSSMVRATPALVAAAVGLGLSTLGLPGLVAYVVFVAIAAHSVARRDSI